MTPDGLRAVSIGIGLITFALGATVGYRLGKRRDESLRIAGAVAGGLIAVPVALVAGTWVEARKLDGEQ